MPVYFIQAGDNGPIKVGVATNVTKRLSGLQTATFAELRVLIVIDGDVSTESELHKRFSHLRIRGEWFEPGQEILDFVRFNLYDRLEAPIKRERVIIYRRPGINCLLDEFWRQKETEWKRHITISEVSDITGLAYSTIADLRQNSIVRWDLGVLDKVCRFFNVPKGAPVPFMTYNSSE